MGGEERIERIKKIDPPSKKKLIRNAHYKNTPEKMKYQKITVQDFFDSREVLISGIHAGNYFTAMTYVPFETDVTEEDFKNYNRVLFPNREDLTIYQWNNDWSSYFESELQGWGALLWTVYDAQSGIMTVIGASDTD